VIFNVDSIGEFAKYRIFPVIALIQIACSSALLRL